MLKVILRPSFDFQLFRFWLVTLDSQKVPSLARNDLNRMSHSDSVFEESATSQSARLPPRIQRIILDFFFSSIRNLGGAVSQHRRSLLAPLKLVNSQWNDYTRHQFDIYPYFDFREPEIDYEEIDDCLRDRKLMRFICHTEGILSISFSNPEEKSLAGRKKCWRKTLDRVVKQFAHMEQLNLWLADADSGECHELLYRFPREQFPLSPSSLRCAKP